MTFEQLLDEFGVYAKTRNQGLVSVGIFCELSNARGFAKEVVKIPRYSLPNNPIKRIPGKEGCMPPTYLIPYPDKYLVFVNKG